MKKILEDFGIAILIIVLVVGISAGLVAYNQWAYHDWTCVFKHCVQVSK